MSRFREREIYDFGRAVKTTSRGPYVYVRGAPVSVIRRVKHRALRDEKKKKKLPLRDALVKINLRNDYYDPYATPLAKVFLSASSAFLKLVPGRATALNASPSTETPRRVAVATTEARLATKHVKRKSASSES